MIYRPQDGAMWDPSVLWHNGKYYAFMMYNKDGRDGLAAGHCLLVTSTDGVHWKDQGTIIDERGRADGGCERIGGKYYLIGGTGGHVGCR